MKRKNIRVFMYLMVCMLVCCVVFVAKVGAVEEKEPIKIGFIYIMSGAHAMYGLNAAAATEIAIDEINKSGGALGRKFTMIARDDKMSPAVGLREAKDLVLNQKVSILTGVLSSGVALAISSAWRDGGEDEGVAAFGEVSLTGKVRYVLSAEKRIQELVRRGFPRILVPSKNAEECSAGGGLPTESQLEGVADLVQAVKWEKARSTGA